MSASVGAKIRNITGGKPCFAKHYGQSPSRRRLAANANDIHRVVTTLDDNNKSTTLFDSNVPLEVGKFGNPGAVLWVTDSNPAGFSQEDTGKRPIGISPPDNGTVIRVVEFPPVDDAKLASMDPNFMMKVVGPTAPAILGRADEVIE
jgi:hypothetical protein